MNQFLRQLPRYRCHKEVSALKIADIIPNPRGFELHFEDRRFAPHQVSEEWIAKHQPEPGWFFVVYEDGYQSCSPAKAFESGYSPVVESENPYMTFGQALEVLKSGFKVARLGWNGAGQFVYLVPAASYPARTDVAKEHFGADAMVPYRAYLALKTTQGDVATWAPSCSDVLTQDWCVVE